MPKTYCIRFEPDGRAVDIVEGATVLEAAIQAGVRMNAPCGGKGTCGGCMVQIPEDPPAVSEAGRRQLTGEEIKRDLRLACQVRISSDMRIVIPDETRLHDQQILEAGMERDVPLSPQVCKFHVHLSEPTITDQRADGERLAEAVALERPGAEVDLPLARELPEKMRKFRYDLTATVVGNRIVRVERGDTSKALYGMAFDIGTTTVVGMLIDLTSGRQLAVGSRTNPQTTYGDDVLARIEYIDRHGGGLKVLSDAIVECLNEIIKEVSAEVGIRATNIYEATAVGNTTMMHIFLKLPVTNIGRAPYTPAFRGGQTVSPRDVGLKINPRGQVYVPPNITGFLGADTTSVILASDMHNSDKLSLAIDIGTNGEIVLGNRQRIIACSTAAGPAFEGARIQYGMRASGGAIDRVDIIDNEVRLHTIHDAAPVGLCGTGLIDAVAELIRVGIVRDTGAFCDAEHPLPEPLKN
ncbi:MAG: ASKHA domain-containing protein, partial [Phycisphaerae bacterium]|nr:ASKHA domain-containing protein [Phycisphaerae bacterium]